MRDLPVLLRRLLGASVLGLPLALAFGPFPFLRAMVVYGLMLLALGLLVLPWLGLQEQMAWQVLLGALAPVAWLAREPGDWWLALARRTGDLRLLTGALDRAEAWGAPEASLEIALNHLASPGLQPAGVRRLEALASQGHPEAGELLAACQAWGLGTPLDPAGARARWVRLGGGPEAPIPPPRPGLVARAVARPPRSVELGLGRGLARVGEATGRFLARSAPARLGLGLLLGTFALLLLAVPVLTTLFSPFTLVLMAFWTPALLLLGGMAYRMRRDHRPRRETRERLQRAEAGEAEAAFRLGLDFDRGAPDIPRDPATARRWYRVAADQGHLEAAVRLAELLQLGVGGLRDREGARALLTRAADAGHPEAARRLEALRRHEADLA